MIRLMPHPRRVRNLSAGGAQFIHLYRPPEYPFGREHWITAIGFLCVLAVVVAFGNKVLRKTFSRDEQVQVIEVTPPPPPVIIRKPPQVIPVPPDPDQPHPPPKVKETPPPPVFGLPEEATVKTGDLAVATGNTLMKPADPVVQKAPPPLPSLPIDLDHQPMVLNTVVPEYPEWAEDQGVTAHVVLLVTIDATGRVSDLAVQRSGGGGSIKMP